MNNSVIYIPKNLDYRSLDDQAPAVVFVKGVWNNRFTKVGELNHSSTSLQLSMPSRLTPFVLCEFMARSRWKWWEKRMISNGDGVTFPYGDLQGSQRSPRVSSNFSVLISSADYDSHRTKRVVHTGAQMPDLTSNRTKSIINVGTTIHRIVSPLL